MSLIIGVVCDACGASDVDEYMNDMDVDNFPRNGWLSITPWENEVKGKPKPDLHVCSITCMRDFAVKILKEEHEHGHDHTH